MRGLTAMLIAGALSGCAAHRVPDRIISTDWTTVIAVPPGTDLAVALDDETVRHGRVREVTATTLTLWERHGADAIPRGSIARVAQRIDRGTARGPDFLRSTLVAAAISGVLGAVVAAMGEND